MAGRTGSATRTDPPVPPAAPVSLRRTISLPLLTFYGLGTTVGAGIYVLVGRIVGIAGPYAPFSFVLAALLAGLSALVFAELAARMPRSAGEALYVRRGLRSRPLALLVGLMVVGVGIVSSATIARGFAGYLGVVVDGPPALFTFAIIALLTAIAIVGILETVIVASVLTVIEVGGLVLVVWVARDSFASGADWFAASTTGFDMALAAPMRPACASASAMAPRMTSRNPLSASARA
jgi:APA family basic amino acid/polyamine antiporter